MTRVETPQCIECRRPKEEHGANGECPWKHKTFFKSMALPDGKTCSDCRHFSFCRQYPGENIAQNTSCDWFPIRFSPRAAQ